MLSAPLAEETREMESLKHRQGKGIKADLWKSLRAKIKSNEIYRRQAFDLTLVFCFFVYYC
ncbi:MAG: hypothetical protein IJZ24_07885, partial [Clostridia bacterium]|nr:hypothetical protein [Clostridia bacterium]